MVDGGVNSGTTVCVASVAKLVAQMRNNPTGTRFSDAVKVATQYFGKPRVTGTSHHVFSMPWAGDPFVNLQEGDDGKAKVYQVRQLLCAIDKLEASGG